MEVVFAGRGLIFIARLKHQKRSALEIANTVSSLGFRVLYENFRDVVYLLLSRMTADSTRAEGVSP
jgi:hypothetical protein